MRLKGFTDKIFLRIKFSKCFFKSPIYFNIENLSVYENYNNNNNKIKTL